MGRVLLTTLNWISKMSANVICFDLEGPLSPQDNAYEVMGLIDNGHKIFEVLSRYDDILAIEGRSGYEPGDTLSLITPFLLYHEISEEDIINVSNSAKIIESADYTIPKLKTLGWKVFIISTSYQQHALNTGRRIGISEDRIYCTKFPLDKYRQEARGINFSVVKDAEKDILEDLYPNLDDSGRIKKRLDGFFYNEVLKTKIGRFMNEVKVIGGQRKVDAVYEISKRSNTTMDKIVAVGDSITDYKMLNEIKSMGGLSIVFNGNEYSIPYATVGIASTEMIFILVVLNAYMHGGKEAVMGVVNSWERGREDFIESPMEIPEEIIPDDVRDFLVKKISGGSFSMPYFHCLENIGEEKREEVIEIHKKFRSLVRGGAAKLG